MKTKSTATDWKKFAETICLKCNSVRTFHVQYRVVFKNMNVDIVYCMYIVCILYVDYCILYVVIW